MSYLTRYASTTTPQSRPIPGSTQVPNLAGGYGFPVSDRTRFMRFLVLGSEKGSYYVSEQQLTLENATAVRRVVAEEGPWAVEQIVQVSDGNRAAKNDPALFALAMAISYGDVETKRMAALAVPKVARTGTHILRFAQYADTMRGWGPVLKRAVASWYTSQDPMHLAYELTKYKERDGWSHRDLLRLSHPDGFTPPGMQQLFRWATGKFVDWLHPDFVAPNDLTHYMAGYYTLQGETKPEGAAQVVEAYRLPREVIPSELLREPAVWKGMLRAGMPYTALVRNLATMTRLQIPKTEGDAISARIIEGVDKARTHPISLLAALKTYQSGKSVRGTSEWTPIPQLVRALDTAFSRAFRNLPRIPGLTLVGIDCSGSMHGTPVVGMDHLECTEAAAAMARVFAASCERAIFVGFTTTAQLIEIGADMPLRDIMAITARITGGTDCAQPFIAAGAIPATVDTFVILSDNETWAGSMHPMEALHAYRKQREHPSRLAALSMAATESAIGDVADAGVLDVCGLDAAVPALVADFAAQGL